MKPRRFKNQRHGYILLTTLLIIAIAGVLSAGLVRQSMSMAMSATRAERELQNKWGTFSCRRLATERRTQLLTERYLEDDRWTTKQIPRTRKTFRLGDQQFVVRIEDESAKFNINHSYRSAGRQKTISMIRQFSKADEYQIQLRPMAEGRRLAMEDEFESWGQIFQTRNLIVSPDGLADATQQLTCWGQGINLGVASDEVVLATASPLIGSAMASRLLKLRNEGNLGQWQEELAAAGAREAGLNELGRIVRTSSTAHSIWVFGTSTHATTTTLSVHESISGSMIRVHSF